jgi:hypothetical protein
MVHEVVDRELNRQTIERLGVDSAERSVLAHEWQVGRGVRGASSEPLP